MSPTPTGEPPRLVWANSERGIAAALVMVGHLLVATVLLQPWIEEKIGFAAGRPLTDYGQVALSTALGVDVMGVGVVLFFLISGLVIARSLRRYSRRGFFVGRCLRLLPTYAAGYALILLVLVLATRLVGVEWHPDTGDLAGFLPGLPVLLQVPSVPNSVAWTLVVEMVFYAVCLVLYRRLLGSAWTLIAIAGGCILIQAMLLNIGIPSALAGLGDLVLVALPFLPVLLIGVHLADPALPRGGLVQLWPVLPLTAASVWMTGFRVWWPFSPLGLEGAGVGYQLTLVATVLLFVLVWRVAPERFDGPLLRRLADISYPLYVVHAMVGWIVILLLVRLGMPEWVAMAVAVAVVAVVAWGLHVGVERPTHRWGRSWARRLSCEPTQASTDR